MTAFLSGVWNAQEFTDLGALGVGMRLYTYISGTTTHKAAYTDSAGSISHTYTSDGIGGQYIGLNARGELPAPIFLTTGAYDLCLKTDAGATVWTRKAIPNNASSDGSLYANNFYLTTSGGTSAGNWGFSTSSGPYIQMWGTASAGTGDMYFHTAGTGRLRLTNAGNFVPVTDNAYACGGVSLRWTNVYGVLGTFGGITFGGSTLSNYAEGTFTPAITGIGSPAYVTQTGEYTRIGNRIRFRIALSWTAGTNGASVATITGLPTASTAAIHPVQLFCNLSNSGLTYTGTPIAYLNGGTAINIGAQASGGSIGAVLNPNAGTKDLYISGEYFV